MQCNNKIRTSFVINILEYEVNPFGYWTCAEKLPDDNNIKVGFYQKFWGGLISTEAGELS